MDADVEVKVTLGSISAVAKDFENLSEGDILFFKKPDYAIASVSGMPLFKGELGTMDAHGGTVCRTNQIIKLNHLNYKA